METTETSNIEEWLDEFSRILLESKYLWHAELKRVKEQMRKGFEKDVFVLIIDYDSPYKEYKYPIPFDINFYQFSIGCQWIAWGKKINDPRGAGLFYVKEIDRSGHFLHDAKIMAKVMPRVPSWYEKFFSGKSSAFFLTVSIYVYLDKNKSP